jgi:23S rRNA (adenine-N6)-dimethyltransferase
VDLGAGEGALSLPLARAGCRVLAVELHPARASALRERAADSRVAVLELDVADFHWPGHPFRVVANPPYAGINALVRRLLAARQLRSADLVVAEGAALGLARRYVGGIELGARLPPHAFRNPPPGPARVLLIR